MRNAKKFLTLALAVLMVMSMFVTGASAAKFTDVDPKNDALNDAVELIANLGITKGTSETTFGTEELVTRQQMAAFMYRLMHAGRSVEGGENTTKFTDLVDPTFNFSIAWANDAGVIKGTTPTTFNPTGSIILQDAYTMIVRALGYEDEETLPYPFGFIDEAEELGLDEELPSGVNYLSELTRGDVAILLYNAFYAEMAESTTVYKINEKTGVLEAVETHPTVASKIFGVEEIDKIVVATPNVSLEDYERTEEGYILFAGDDEATEFAKLGLSGSADDYFLADITLYKKGSKIIAAQSYLETATGKIEFVLDKNADDYDSKKSDAENPITGEFKVGDIKGYLVDAPKKNGNQLNNVGFLTLLPIADTKKSKTTMTYKIGSFAGEDALERYDEELATARKDGYYEATVYDCDGDGYADFAWYKEYTFGKLYVSETKANKEYTETLLKKHINSYKYTAIEALAKNADIKEPLIYAQEAMLKGVSAKNGDYVVAYVNGPANYISVGEVVTGNEGTVKRISAKNEFTLTNGDVVKNANLEGLILGKYDYSDKVKLGNKGVFYSADGRLVYYKEIEEANDDQPYYGDIALIIEDEDNEDKAYYTETAKVDGKISSVNYAYAWIDGEINYVELADYADDDEEVKQNKKYINDLIGEVSSYEIDGDGKYIFKKIDFASYTDKLDTDDEDAVFGTVKTADTAIKKVVNNIYEFGNEAYHPYKGSSRFSFAANARMIIKSVDNDKKPVYTLYTDEDLPSFKSDLKFGKVAYIMVNNTTSEIEKLALLYAETNDAIDYDEENKEYRIVADAFTEYDAEKKTYTNYYNLYNPQTGETEENVIGKSANSSKPGKLAAPYSIYELGDDVLLDKTEALWDLTDDSKLAMVTEYDEANKLVRIGDQYYKYDDIVVTKLFIPDENDEDEEATFEKVDVSALDINVDENKRYCDTSEEYIGIFVLILKESDVKNVDFYKNLETVVIVDKTMHDVK